MQNRVKSFDDAFFDHELNFFVGLTDLVQFLSE